MAKQNEAIVIRFPAEHFSTPNAVLLCLRSTAANLKMVLPSLVNSPLVVFISVLFVAALYIFTLKTAGKEQRRDLILLLILSIGSSIFLFFLCIKARHSIPLYTRYYTFCVPFATLFIVYMLKVLYEKPSFKRIFIGVITATIVLPCLLYFFNTVIKSKTITKYNCVEVAQEVEQKHIAQLAVPRWNAVFLVNSLLPPDYSINYIVNTGSLDFILYGSSGEEKIPIISKVPMINNDK